MQMLQEDEGDLVTLQATRATRRRLKEMAASRGITMVDLLNRLVDKEYTKYYTEEKQTKPTLVK